MTPSRAAKPTGKLVRVNRDTLAVTGSLTLFTADVDEHSRVRSLTITPDGTRGAVAAMGRGSVYVVDLVNMTLVTEVDVSGTAGRFCEDAAISPDGATVYLACKGDGHQNTLAGVDLNIGDITVIDVATSAVTGTITPPNVVTAGADLGISGLRFGPDGMLYLGVKNSSTDADGVTSYNPGTNTFTDITNLKRVCVHLGCFGSARGGRKRANVHPF